MEEEYQDQIVRLMQAERTDVLTGLGNYRAFREYIMNLWHMGVGYSVVLFDMTNLKAANEALGHFGADVLLRNVGALIRGGGWDAVFRHGGDEFAVVLPCCPTGGALKVRDRIEEHVGESHVLGGKVVRIIGSVCTITPDMSVDAELNRADKALEQRKKQWKNA